jgi:CubicO group peptidase (beta-lactamase class C family)
MSEAVLTPLGMTTAGFAPDSSTAPAFDGDLQPRPHRRHTALAAVSLYATARDLSRFVLAFTAPNPVLRDDTLQRMMQPQPGTGGSWGLGQTLFARTGAGGYVVGHDGGSPPAWGAMVRVNPASGNGMVLLSSGGRGAVNRLGHDWLYWETGVVGFEARRQVVQDRIVPASFVLLLGAIVIVLWRHARRSA